MADLPAEPVTRAKVRVESPTIPEFVVTITASSEGLFVLTSYGKMWRLKELSYPYGAWGSMPLPPLEGVC